MFYESFGDLILFKYKDIIQHVLIALKIIQLWDKRSKCVLNLCKLKFLLCLDAGIICK